MKRIISIILLLTLLCSLTACDGDDGPAKLLSFSQAQSISEMEKLDGEKVTILGYMSTLSPVSGEFMYLMNLPYQSCPFCIPNTTTLSNTIAVYAKDEFEFTDSAIRVTGELEFGDYEDEFGYQYGYRIIDAEYEELDASDMSDKLKLWQQLAASDVIADVYEMFDYVNFLTNWTSYYMNFESGEDYLYPSDAIYFIETDGAQFNYGFKSDYFDKITNTVKAVNETEFSELISIINDAKLLASKAYTELKNGNYTQVAEYSGRYNDGRKQYKLTKATELKNEMDGTYSEFSTWISGWEL
jgi:hypothetical protein